MRNRSLVERKGREGGLGGMRRSRQAREKRGRRSRVGGKGGREEGKSDCQKRGAVVYMATGNRPSYVHQLTSTSQHWWPTTALLWAGGAGGGVTTRELSNAWFRSLMGITSASLRGFPKKKKKRMDAEEDVGRRKGEGERIWRKGLKEGIPCLLRRPEEKFQK